MKKLLAQSRIVYEGRRLKARSSKKIHVLIADDHPLLLSGFVAELANYPDLDVLGTTTSSDNLVEEYRRLKPDVLIADLFFVNSKLRGIDALRQLLEADPHAHIVVLTMNDQDRLITEAYRIGVMAFMLKNTTTDELVMSIREAHKGSVYFMPEISKRLAKFLTHGPKNPVDALPEREFQIFEMLALGKTNIEIAKELKITVRTVANQAYTIKQKLNAATSADLTRIAIAYDIIEPLLTKTSS